jgi:hypothetical protein
MLGKLKKVELRNVWKNEATDFTKWLSENENLSLLADEIGIDINLLQTEASVGRYNVDILAEEENTGRKIIIENQLEPTNHDHLGKLITYASGIDAEISIWIVSDVRDEHKQAIDWLNEHTDENIYFFAIKMELWQIGDSNIAPKFQIIAKPNEWANAVKISGIQSQLTATNVMQLDFWKQFKEYVKDKTSVLRLRTPRPQHWYNFSIGSSDAHISASIKTQQNIISVEIYIPNSKELFHALYEMKDEIEKEFGEGLNWMELLGKKASKIVISKEADIDDVEKWEQYFDWLQEQSEKLFNVFSKKIKKAKK